MNKIILVIPTFLSLMLISGSGTSNAFAHNSNNFSNMQTYQQTCVNDRCAQGYTDGENQAYSDWSSGHKYDYCPSGHSNDYCSQYVLGYGDEWNRSIQQDFGTEQTQGASVDVHGNNNKVNIEQGQQSTDTGFSGSSSSRDL
jgi:hypothetical protein